MEQSLDQTEEQSSDQTDKQSFSDQMDLTNKILVSEIHPHELCHTIFKNPHRCNVCATIYIESGYRCPNEKCDYDYCTECYDTKNITVETPLFNEEPFGGDFYDKEITVEIDSNHYKEIITMYFHKLANPCFTSWVLVAENTEKTIKIYFTDGHKLTECKHCYLQIVVKSETPLNMQPMECDYIKETDKPLYQVEPEELRKTYFKNILVAQKKHLDKILHEVFNNNVVLTLRGTFCA